MKSQKKVVDLIYVELQKDDTTTIKDFNFSLDFWKNSLKNLQEQYFEEHFNSTSPDVVEILNMRRFIGKFIQTRLDWVDKEVKDKDLRKKYLKVLPPFTQKAGIKNILLHFFQMIEADNKKGLIYKAKNDIEKEICILWDIYKLRRTIESIETIKKSLEKSDAFPSIFDVKKRIECIESLKAVFQLMFQMCIKKEYQKQLYSNFSSDLINPLNVLKRLEANQSFIYQHVIQKFDYRNHFFYVYFSAGMKAKVNGKIKAYHYNFLDFEIIKQEFLINWMKEKLQGSQKKNEIYNKYCVGNKKISEIIAEDPSKEVEILQQLPLSVFNDITSEVNDVVSDDLKTDVETFSENHGEFAAVATEFEEAKEVSKSPIKNIRKFFGKKAPVQDLQAIAEEIREEMQPELESPVKIDEPSYKVFQVKKNQIDYPYFLKETGSYKTKMSLIRVKMGPSYTEFNKKLSKFFANVADSAVIRRRTPKHEVIFPHVVEETLGDMKKNHLIILGAEVKAKQLGMGYASKSSESTHSYTCFFQYGSEQEDISLGKSVETRNARGMEFKMYDFANEAVQKKMLKLFDIIMK